LAKLLAEWAGNGLINRTEECDRHIPSCSSLAWAQKTCLVSWHMDGQKRVTERSWWVGLQGKVCRTLL